MIPVKDLAILSLLVLVLVSIILIAILTTIGPIPTALVGIGLWVIHSHRKTRRALEVPVEYPALRAVNGTDR